jgi:hypothetical protein
MNGFNERRLHDDCSLLTIDCGTGQGQLTVENQKHDPVLRSRRSIPTG